MIHFLLLEQSGHIGVDEWDPDTEPNRFADGIGHNLVELLQRLRHRGHVVTSGSRIPPRSTLVVLMPQQFTQLGRIDRLRLGWRLRRFRVLSIRSDFLKWSSSLIRIDAEVVPNRAVERSSRRVSVHVLPPLIQRGLIRRSPERGGRITVVGVKSNPGNVPPQLLEPRLADALGAMDIDLVIDSPTVNDGSDQHWHDFSGLDVVICARRDWQATAHKPPTKLLNAWAAGVIPLARREPAYTEIARDGHDVVFFDRFDEIPTILSELRADDERRNRLWKGVAESAADLPTTDEALDVWWELLEGHERPPSTWRSCRSVAYLLARGIPSVVIGAIRRRWRTSRRPATTAAPSSVS